MGEFIMGHAAGKDILKALAKRIDGTSCRAPLNKNFYELLSELYDDDEARLAVRMPYTLANINQISKITGFEKKSLTKK